jgi:glycosyltransferase involved in cell wall biosynthesis
MTPLLMAWKIPPVGLVIVGSGSEESELKNLAQKLGIENAVIFEGWQNNLASYYKTCDCFLVTSWYEGYGMTLVEAAAVGTKIVSTDVGIAKEVVAEVVGYRPEDAGYGILQTIT